MFSAYGAAKTALVRFGETLASETAGKGVRVNSVAPGAFASRMTHVILAQGERAGTSELEGAERAIAANDSGMRNEGRKACALSRGGRWA